jgi:predicted DCC family thiol-disulfide oxidoreductase YuxK
MSTQDETAPAQKCTVYYDGECPICRVEIGAYKALDRTGAVTYTDVTSSPGDPASDLDRAAALKRFHVRLGDGRLISGGRAFVALWRETPGFRWLGRIGSAPPLIWLAEPVYRVFLVVRPGLQAFARLLINLSKKGSAPKSAP